MSDVSDDIQRQLRPDYKPELCKRHILFSWFRYRSKGIAASDLFVLDFGWSFNYDSLAVGRDWGRKVV